MILLPIVCIFLTLPQSSEELPICIFLIIVFSLISIFFFVIFGFLIIQWVVITDETIVAKCLFKTIQKSEWRDVKEIKQVAMSYQPLNPKMNWLVFIDSKDSLLYPKSPFNFKGRYIRIKASKKNRKFLETLKPDVKFTLYENE